MTYRLTALTAAIALVGAMSFSYADAHATGMRTSSTSLAPAGQGPGLDESWADTSGSSNLSRAGVKAQTQSAQATGQLTPAGEATEPVGKPAANTEAGRAMAINSSQTTRASVNAQTVAARSAGALQPASDTSQPAGDMPPR